MKKRVASILLADADLASRLTLTSLLSKAGYGVDGAASASEAIGKLDRNEYQLVLTDLRNESGDEGAGVLAYARQKEFHPATARISSDLCEARDGHDSFDGESAGSVIRISDDNVSYLLGKVADLIGNRADRRIRLALRQQN